MSESFNAPDSFAARFAARLIQERVSIEDALRQDLESPLPPTADGWEESHLGELMAELRPRVGFSPAERLYQEAVAEAGRKGVAGIVQPLLQSARDAHEKLIKTALKSNLDFIFWEHSEAVQRLIDNLGTVAAAPAQEQWSKPDSPTQWAKTFGVSYDTMKEWLEKDKIRNQKISPRRYRIHVDDLPKK